MVPDCPESRARARLTGLLVACTHLYKPLGWSVGWLVGWSVGRSHRIGNTCIWTATKKIEGRKIKNGKYERKKGRKKGREKKELKKKRIKKITGVSKMESLLIPPCL